MKEKRGLGKIIVALPVILFLFLSIITYFVLVKGIILLKFKGVKEYPDIGFYPNHDVLFRTVDFFENGEKKEMLFSDAIIYDWIDGSIGGDDFEKTLESILLKDKKEDYCLIYAYALRGNPIMVGSDGGANFFYLYFKRGGIQKFRNKNAEAGIYKYSKKKLLKDFSFNLENGREVHALYYYGRCL